MEKRSPAYNLEVNSMSHGAMTGQMMEKIEKVLEIEQPDALIVYGDTNSTIAGALAAKKMNINSKYKKTIDILTSAAYKNSFSISEISKTIVDEFNNLYEVLIRENNKNNHIDVKVAIAGNVNCGKSTLMGSLTSGIHDNGRGLARLSVCNYIHEVKSGRTSSIGQQIIGFDHQGKMINYKGIGSKLSWPEIVNKSSKVINFFDC